MITEGDEESGGHIDYYIEALKERIGNPEIIFCLDSGAIDYERLWMTNSLRGNVAGILKVKNLSEGVHSGDSSGIVPNVMRIANLIVQRLENLQTGRIHDDFHVDIPANRYEESIKLSKIVGMTINNYGMVEGSRPVSENPLELILNRAWRPQLVVTGITGLSPVKSAGNVMIPECSMRLSLRLPPTYDAKKS